MRSIRWPILFVIAMTVVIGGSMYLASDLLGYAYPQGVKEGSLQTPLAMQGADIIDRRGTRIPLDIKLTNHIGQSVVLSDYFKAGGAPLLLTLGYYECPMLCNLVLNGLIDSMKGMNLKLGQDFNILSVSIDPKEKIEIAAEKRANYLASFAVNEHGELWPFHIGEETEVKRLADSVGFGYRYDETIKQYAHAAGVFVLSSDGTLSRTLYGIQYKAADLKFSLMEASNGRIGSLMDKVLLTCFHYDPDSHKYGVYIFGLMRVGGLLTVLVLGAVLVFLWRRDRYIKVAS